MNNNMIYLMLAIWLFVVGGLITFITYEAAYQKAYAIGMQDAKNEVIRQCNSILPLRIDGYEFWCRGVR